MPGKKAAQATPNYRLRQARQRRGWRQKDVVDKIGAPNSLYVSRWECGTSYPSPLYQQKLCTLFQMTAEELGFLVEDVSRVFFDPLTPVYDPAIPARFADTHDFVGRDELLAHVKQLLCSSKAPVPIILQGLPGVGKTTLAVEIIHDPDVQEHFRDGLLWAGLGQHPNIVGILSRWGKLLGMHETDMQALQNDEEWAMTIRNAIGKRQMLLVIDDVWKVEDALAFELDSPSCAFLITTRISDIAVYFRSGSTIAVQELNEDDGVALLTRWVPTIVQNERGDTRTLVRAVGGLPLALTLMGGYLFAQAYYHQPRRIRSALTRLRDAGERLKLESPQGGLKHHPSLLQGNPISLLAVIGVSEQALDDTSRQALHALSVFPPKPNTFAEEAALAVAATTTETLDHLVDTGLVEVSGEARFTLHQTIADYARLKQRDANAERRMVAYYISFLKTHQADYTLLDLEFSNVFAALQTAFDEGMSDALVQGANTFASFLEARGRYTVAENFLNRALQVALSFDDADGLAEIWLHLGRITQWRGNYTQAEALCLKGLVVARERDEKETMCSLLIHCGEAALYIGEYVRAAQYFTEGLELAHHLENDRAASVFLKNLGEIADSQGNHTKAKGWYQQGLQLARAVDDQESISILLQDLGVNAERGGEYGKAETLYQQGLAVSRAIGNPSRISALLMNLGMVAIRRGQYDEAECYSLESLQIAREIGDQPRIGSVLQNLGILASQRGDYLQAEAYLQESLSIAQQLDHRWLISETLCELGELQLKKQQLDLAYTAFDQARTIAQRMSAYPLVAAALYGFARISALQGDTDQANRLGQESLAFFRDFGEEKANEVRQWLQTLPDTK
jgi:tetratricopeptide (TPR) repeat protein/transcriptional regulator with XRE-family HTH domain